MIRRRGDGSLPQDIRHRLMSGTMHTPSLSTLTRMQTRMGLLTSYWHGDKKTDAYMFTLGILGLTGAISWNGVQLAIQASEVWNARAFFQDPSVLDPMGRYMTSLVDWFAMIGVQVSMVSTRHWLSTNHNRKWRGWMCDQLTQKILGDKRVLLHLMHNQDHAEGAPTKTPDNIEQRVADCSKDYTAGATGLAMGFVGACITLGTAIWELSKITVPVKHLEFMGEYGTLGLAFGAAALCVPLATYGANKIGNVLARVNARMQEAEASYRGNLRDNLGQAFNIVATKGQALHKKVNDLLYKDVDTTWKKQNNISVGFMTYTGLYNPFSSNFMAFMPGLPAFASHAINFNDYMKVSGVTATIINAFEWFIDVLPARANLRVNADRFIEVVKAIQAVDNEQEFYNRTGIARFKYLTHEPGLGLIAQDIKLMHKNHSGIPFLQANRIHLKPGDWARVTGPNGAGKSLLLKVLEGKGLWPYGSGKIITNPQDRVFYAPQDIKLPVMTLKQLVCYPDPQENQEDRRIAHALEMVGLDEQKFLSGIGEPYHEGKPWDQVLSGGEKQKLVLARILLQKPDIIFLDEATSALDVQARQRFHELLRDHCPDSVVISIIHAKDPLLTASGRPFYNYALDINEGVLTQRATTGPLMKPEPAYAHHVFQHLKGAFQGPVL